MNRPQLLYPFTHGWTFLVVYPLFYIYTLFLTLTDLIFYIPFPLLSVENHGAILLLALSAFKGGMF